LSTLRYIFVIYIISTAHAQTAIFLLPVTTLITLFHSATTISREQWRKVGESLGDENFLAVLRKLKNWGGGTHCILELNVG